ncbi:hypothetical protein GALL_476830 [mine drainage metagenome]|uniref:Uncharacterized protein n=1 Tax=mine drainage metagenome TaxID=410659 RepID=A0A1J5Q4B0_9ZZZZ
MQPKTAHAGRGQAQFVEVPADVLGGHRTHILEHFASFLVKQQVTVVRVAVFTARHVASVVADVVGKSGQQLRAQNFKGPGCGMVQPLNQNGGADIAKNKVAVAVFPGQMG